VSLPPKPDDPSHFGDFAGIINTRSRKAIGLKGLYKATNVLLSDEKKLYRRPGMVPYFAGAVRGGFTVGSDVYLDDAGSLKRRVSPTDIRVVTSGLTGRVYHCVVYNGAGYYCNGVESGVVRGDLHQPLRIAAPNLTGVVLQSSTALTPGFARMGADYVTAKWRFCTTYETADGREGPPSIVFVLDAPVTASLFRVACDPGYAKTHIYCTEPDGTTFRRIGTTVAQVSTWTPALAGRVLTHIDTYPMPVKTEKLTFCDGRLYAAEYIPEDDSTVIWHSLSFGFHLFKQRSDYQRVAGRVVLMVEIGKGKSLLIVTTHQVCSVTDGALTVEAEYGAPPGHAGEVNAEGTAYFWTVRGLCSALPFKNIHEADLSVAPGMRAVCKLVYINGSEMAITITQGGGTPFNRRSEVT